MYPLRPLESEVQQATRLVKEMLDALDDDGTAILLLPRPNSDVRMTKNSKCDKKGCLESGCLQAVISITNASYNHLGIETALLLMRKNPLFQGRIRLLEAPRIGQETHEIREIDISKTLENFKAESQNVAAFDLEPSELVNWDYSRTLLQHRLQERHQKEARSLNPMQQQLEKLGQLIWKAEAIAETALGLPLFEIAMILGNTPRIVFERPDLSLLDVVKESDKDYKTFSLKIPHFLVSPWNPVIDKIALPVSDEQIAVSNRLLVFRDGPSNADVDFILLQLNSEFLRDQLNILGNFQRLKEITVDEFLDLHVVIELDVAEQRRIVKKHKLRLLDGKKEELKHQKQRLGIEDAETKILEILGHELRPLLSNVNNHTVLTQHYIQEKAVSKEPISLCHKLGERVDSHTISSSFELIQKNLKRMGNLIDSLEGILDADVSKMNLRRVSLFEEWHDRLNRMALENEISCLAICEKNTRDFPNHGDFAVNLDEAAFEIAISNLFSNAFKHGFEDAGFENRFLCMFSCQEAYDGSMWVILDIMNNGKPMPEGMTTEKFIELGGSMGETKGSGIGGFLVHKIIENHAGKFRLMYPGEIGYHLMGLEQANLFQPQKMNLGRKAFNVGFRIEIPYCHDGIEAKS